MRKPIHFYIFVAYNNRSICTYCLPSFVLSLANNYIADDKNNRHTLKYESNDKGGIQVPLNEILCFDWHKFRQEQTRRLLKDKKNQLLISKQNEKLEKKI